MQERKSELLSFSAEFSVKKYGNNFFQKLVKFFIVFYNVEYQTTHVWSYFIRSFMSSVKLSYTGSQPVTLIEFFAEFYDKNSKNSSQELVKFLIAHYKFDMGSDERTFDKYVGNFMLNNFVQRYPYFVIIYYFFFESFVENLKD